MWRVLPGERPLLLSRAGRVRVYGSGFRVGGVEVVGVLRRARI